MRVHAAVAGVRLLVRRRRVQLRRRRHVLPLPVDPAGATGGDARGRGVHLRGDGGGGGGGGGAALAARRADLPGATTSHYYRRRLLGQRRDPRRRVLARARRSRRVPQRRPLRRVRPAAPGQVVHGALRVLLPQRRGGGDVAGGHGHRQAGGAVPQPDMTSQTLMIHPSNESARVIHDD
uniref:Uncharacterized protein n=1 Tax=Oryza nivara TaxID=4536 RepID=A0A0E0FRC6_ORYNI